MEGEGGGARIEMGAASDSLGAVCPVFSHVTLGSLFPAEPFPCSAWGKEGQRELQQVGCCRMRASGATVGVAN